MRKVFVISTASNGLFRADIGTTAAIGTRLGIDLKTAEIIFGNRFHGAFCDTAFTLAALVRIDDIGHLFC